MAFTATDVPICYSGHAQAVENIGYRSKTSAIGWTLRQSWYFLASSWRLLSAQHCCLLSPALSTEGLWYLHAGMIIVGVAALLPMPTRKVLRETILT